ncbi:MAG: hypothetical protein KJ799_00720 [Bacteroidetes bacterium]|nr:hypothetical protein [Bacteroidota bacterium]MBU2505240.1 hypothetical protein [Bacteroidota bacterium]
MDRKLKNTLALTVILIFVIALGSFYAFYIQSNDQKEKKSKIADLNLNAYNTAELLDQLNTLQKRVAELDSILAMRKYNIPAKLTQSKFYDFVNRVSYNFSPQSFVNIEYEDIIAEEFYSYYTYKLSGTATFNDVYSLIYAMEQSKELKKVLRCNFVNFVQVDKEGIPHYLVSYNIFVAVYFSIEDRFTSATLKENRLIPNPIYDVFYPLIRNEIPPNKDNLLDVQTAQLLALIPDGAFLVDSGGRTYLLWEGDQVYLGYVTEIDYHTNQVSFILNKGGLIEKITLSLGEKKRE